MCSPEPGKGASGGLSEFWSCLDPKQRDSLLTINGCAVQEILDCSLCRDLAKSATLALEEESNGDIPPPSPASSAPNAPSSGGGGKGKPKTLKHRPKLKAAGLRVIGGRAFLADWVGGPELKRRGPCFVKYMAGVYVLQPGKVLDSAVRAMEVLEAPWEAVVLERGCYCEGKILLRVVDMLTYPRPVRKFEILVEKETELLKLRELMLCQVKVGSLLKLVLLTRGKAIAHSQNHLTLAQLGFKNRQQLVVSQVLGEPAQDETGMEQKNRQFVGDLLFGGGGGGGTNKGGRSSAPKPDKREPSSPLPPPPPPPPPIFSSTSAIAAKNAEKGVETTAFGESLGWGGSGDGEGSNIEELLDLIEGGEGAAAAAAATGMLANGIAGVGVEGEVGGEPGTGRVPSLIANHGFQVLGKALSRLARFQVAEAWRAELKSREHEIRLLEELEAEAVGGVEEEGTASKRRSKKAKKKERDKKRREEEKRLQQEEEEKKEQLRKEKIRLAEERVEEERRAKLLQERAEQERQEQLWKRAQEKRLIAEREQLQAQMALLRVGAEDEDDKLTEKSAPPHAKSAEGGGGEARGGGGGDKGGRGGGKEKKNKGKKQHRQQQQQQQQRSQQQRQQHRTATKGTGPKANASVDQGASASAGKLQQQQQQQHAHSTAPTTANGIIGSRVAAATAAAATTGGAPGIEGATNDGSSSAVIANTISQFAGITNAQTHPQQQQHLEQVPQLSPVSASQAVVGAAALRGSSPPSSSNSSPAPQQQQYQSQHVPPGPIAPPPTRNASSLPHNPTTPPLGVVSAGYAPQQVGPGTTTSLPTDAMSRVVTATTTGLAQGVLGATAPADTVMVSTRAGPPAPMMVAGAVGVGGSGTGVPIAAANFCAFCGGRLVALTANFCAFCGARVIRTPEEVERGSSSPLTPSSGLVVPTPRQQQQQPQEQQQQQSQQSFLSRAVTPPHQHGTVGDGRGKQGHGQSPQPQSAHSPPPPPSQQQHQQHPQSCPSSSSFLPQNLIPLGGGGSGAGVGDGGGGGEGTGGGSSGDRGAVGSSAGDGAGSSSGSLPFFQQFRGANGSGDRSGGGGGAHSPAASTAPEAGRSTLGGGQAAVGAAPGGGGGGGSSTLEGILDGVIGPLNGSDVKNGNVNDARRPW